MGTFRLTIGENDCDIWNQHSKTCQNTKKFAKRKKKQTIFGPKMPYLGILDCMFEKVLSHFKHPRICQNGKSHRKLKILNFGTKNV